MDTNKEAKVAPSKDAPQAPQLETSGGVPLANMFSYGHIHNLAWVGPWLKPWQWRLAGEWRDPWLLVLLAYFPIGLMLVAIRVPVVLFFGAWCALLWVLVLHSRRCVAVASLRPVRASISRSPGILRLGCAALISAAGSRR